MNTKTLGHVLAVLFIFLAAGCSPAANSLNPTSQETGSKTVPGPYPTPAKPGSVDFNRDGLSSYSATYQIQFKGEKSWSYQLKTRKTPGLREESLHIEGIDPSLNPGDVRVVTDGTTTWMIGPGTDNECVQFPNHQGMDPTFIYPESMLPGEEMQKILRNVGEQLIAGKPTNHYRGSSPASGDLKDVRVEVWQEKTSQALLRFTFQASGSDSFFGNGSGQMQASYLVNDFNEAKIEPVKGCEISVALPDNATRFVRLPGMASFETRSSAEEVTGFYQSALANDGWAENEAPSQVENSTVLSFKRGTEGVEIHVQAVDGGSKVDLIFMKGQ